MRRPGLFPLLLALACASGCDVAGRDLDITAPAPGTPAEQATTAPPPPPPAKPRPIPLPGCVPQRAATRLCVAWTDNYKASFNEDPSVPETRSWLPMRSLQVAGSHLVPAAAEQIQQEPVLCSSRQCTAPRSLTHTVTAGAELVQLLTYRIGPQEDQWGPLLQLTRPLRPGERIAIRLAVPDAPPVLVEYRYDRALATAAERSLEHNGPGGRWFIGGVRTPTNVELGRE